MKKYNFESKNIIFYKYLKNGKEQEAIKYKIDSQKECRVTYKLINQLVSGKISITIDDASIWMSNRIIDIEFNQHNDMDDEWFYFENPDYI